VVGFGILFLGGLVGGVGYFRLIQDQPSATLSDLAISIASTVIGAICIVVGIVLTEKDVPGGRPIAMLFGGALFVFGGIFQLPWLLTYPLNEQIQVVLNLLFGFALAFVTWRNLRD
jgi:hypothetical protein